MWKLSGWFMMVTGILHTALAIFHHHAMYRVMIKNGISNSGTSSFETQYAFWYCMVGLALILFGQLMRYYIQDTKQPLPLGLGLSLLLVVW